MFRGNWRYIIAAVCGLVAVSAAVSWGAQQLNWQIEHQRARYRYQPARDDSAPSLRVAVQPKPRNYDPNCAGPIEREDSDLCAQWSAVEAVNESNGLTRINLWFGFVTILFTTIATLLLIWTFRETRRTSRAELRAYLFPDGVALVVVTEGPNKGKVVASLRIKNSGQTPAFNVVHWADVLLSDFQDQSNLIPPPLAGPSNPIPPGGDLHKHVLLQTKPTRADLAAVKAGKKAAFVYGRIEYLDAFGATRHTNYRLHYSGVWPPFQGHQLFYSENGNDAT
jgi:hypothetical protein